MARVGIIGGGAFGTAMACVMRRAEHEVTLWAREPEVAASINGRRHNSAYLAGVELAAGIAATTNLARAAAGADVLLLAPPAQHMRGVAGALRPHLAPGTPVVSCSKGIERGSLALMPEVLAEALPQARVAVLSGPSFAGEIARGLPCGVVLACAEPSLRLALARALGSPAFCVHPSDDVVGAALGGVMKNVIAIASGAAAGRRLGESARATVVTLGLQEAARLGVAKGARRETFEGLAGAGDMMLTANSLQSRNTTLGFALGEGRGAAEVLRGRREVTEGAHSTAAVLALAHHLGVDMPVSAAVDAVLNGRASVDEMIERLCAQPR